MSGGSAGCGGRRPRRPGRMRPSAARRRSASQTAAERLGRTYRAGLRSTFRSQSMIARRLAPWPGEGGCSPPAPCNSVCIPHDVENRRVATRPAGKRIRSSAPSSTSPPQVTKSSGTRAQGGDTGSNPVGTTAAEVQVTAQVPADVRHEPDASTTFYDPAGLGRLLEQKVHLDRPDVRHRQVEESPWGFRSHRADKRRRFGHDEATRGSIRQAGLRCYIDS
jgi:hypothetical protein